MIVEAIEKIVNMAKLTVTPKFTNRPGDPDDVVHLISADGSVHFQESKPGYRFVNLQRIEQLTSMAVAHFDKEVADQERLLIAYNLEQIVLYFDHKSPREGAKVDLYTTNEWDFFDRFAGSGDTVSVQDLVKTLRLVLHHTGYNEKFLAQIQSLEIINREANTQEAERGRESLGVQVKHEVADVSTLPELMQRFQVRRFSNSDLPDRLPLTCLLDPDVRSRQWFLKPDDDSVSEIYGQHLDLIGGIIRKHIGDRPVKIFEGRMGFSKSKGVDGNPL